jgi:hypothetical protein
VSWCLWRVVVFVAEAVVQEKNRCSRKPGSVGWHALIRAWRESRDLPFSLRGSEPLPSAAFTSRTSSAASHRFRTALAGFRHTTAHWTIPSLPRVHRDRAEPGCGECSRSSTPACAPPIHCGRVARPDKGVAGVATGDAPFNHGDSRQEFRSIVFQPLDRRPGRVFLDETVKTSQVEFRLARADQQMNVLGHQDRRPNINGPALAGFLQRREEPFPRPDIRHALSGRATQPRARPR